MPPAVVERLEFNISRDKKGIFGIGIDETRLGAAVVSRLEGPAKSAGLLAVGDRIAGVDGKNALDYKGVVAALKAAEKSCKVTVARGEPPEPPAPKSTAGNTLMAVTLMSLLVGVAATQFPDLVPSETLTALDNMLPPSISEALSSGRAAFKDFPEYKGYDDEPPAEEPPSPTGKAIRVNNKKFTIEEDGSATDPDGLRAAFRADKGMLTKMRQERPEWARVIDGRPDGSCTRAAEETTTACNAHPLSLSLAHSLPFSVMLIGRRRRPPLPEDSQGELQGSAHERGVQNER